MIAPIKRTRFYPNGFSGGNFNPFHPRRINVNAFTDPQIMAGLRPDGGTHPAQHRDRLDKLPRVISQVEQTNTQALLPTMNMAAVAFSATSSLRKI